MYPGLMFYRWGFVLVLLLLLGPLAPVVLGQPTLHRVGPPGGTVTDLAITATGPHVVYAAWTDHVTGASLFRADALPESGRYVGSHGSDVAVHPTSPHIVFSGSSRSEDGGASWSEMPGVVQVLAFHPLQPDTLWARGNEQLLVSHDAGSTWMPLADTELHALAASAAAPDVLFGLTAAAVLRSDDAGATWAETAFDNGEPLSVTVHPQDATTVYVGSAEGLFRSHDAGATWESRLNEQPVVAIELHPIHADWLFVVVGNPSTIMISMDAGQSWDERWNVSWGGVRVLRINPQQPHYLYAGTGLRGVFRSQDAGDSWSSVTVAPAPVGLKTDGPGYHYYNTSKLPFSLDPSQAGRILVNPLHQGTIFSYDEGISWHILDYNTFDLTFELQVHDVQFAPIDPSLLYATARGRSGAIRTKKLLWSDDGGATWSDKLSVVTSTEYLGRIAVHFDNPAVIAMSAGYFWTAIWLSQDSGETWQTHDNIGAALDVLFVPERPDMLLVSTHFNPYWVVWISNDLGQTWTQINDGFLGGRLHVAAGDPPVVYVAPIGPGTSAYRSSVDEIAWEEIDLSPYVPDAEGRVRHVVTVPDQPGRLYAALTSGLYTSEDDGVSWEQLFDLPMHYLVVDPHVPGRLWAASYREGIYRIEGLPVSTETVPPETISLSLGAPYPNPSRSDVRLSLTAPPGSDVTVTVYDLLGRPVRSLAVPAAGGGEQVELQWDGRDDAGRRVPAGVYVIVAATATERTARMVMVLD